MQVAKPLGREEPTVESSAVLNTPVGVHEFGADNADRRVDRVRTVLERFDPTGLCDDVAVQ